MSAREHSLGNGVAKGNFLMPLREGGREGGM